MRIGKALKFALALILAAGSAAAQTITINWTSTQQTIDGFGASLTGITLSTGPPSMAEMDALFRADIGIGLSIAGLEILPNNTDCYSEYSSGWGYVGSCISASGGTTLPGEVAAAQEVRARAPDALFFAAQWSPDGAYKDSGVFNGSGTVIESSANFTAIANEIAQGVTLWQSYGIPLYGVAPQEEPDHTSTFVSCAWSAANLSDFVPYLYSALAGSTGIMLAETSAWTNSYFNTAMSNYSSDIATITAHGFSTSNPSPLSITNQTTQHVWQTQDCHQGTYNFDGSMTSGITWAQTIHNYIANANVNAWAWWFLSDEEYQGSACTVNSTPCSGTCADDSALVDCNGNISKRAYVTGQWSKFVRPGWHRVGVTNSGSLLVTAFENSSGSNTAIVIVNTSSSPVSNQAFSVGTQMGSWVQPWITSASYSLAPQASVAVSSGTVTYTIPATSVVTLYGPPIVLPPSGVHLVPY